MTYITQLHPQKSKSGLKIAAVTLLALMLIALQSSSANAQWTTNGNNINTTNTGSVGIGTTTPTTLQSGLSGLAGKVVQVQNPSGLAQLVISGSTTGSYIGFETVTATAGRRLFQQAYEASSNAMIFRVLHGANGSVPQDNILVLKNTGNVGIGTSAPIARLDVKDTNNFQVTPNQSAAGEFPTSVLVNSAGTGLTLLPDGNGTAGPKLFLGYRDTAAPMWRSALEIANTSGYGNLLLMKSGGNVGIGTTSPLAKLHVAGNFRALGNYSTYVADGLFGATATPSTVITPGANAALLFGYEDYGLGDYSPRIGFKQTYHAVGSPSLTTTAASLGLVRNGDLVIKGGSGNAEQMRLTFVGNVGIGNSNPVEKLDIAGNIKVTGPGNITATGTITGGTINAKYQDVAEWVPATHALPAGTVVTLDPTKSNHVEASSKAYDTRVAGVISAQPGIALGERGENKVLVATTGRVRIKVDASHGPIQVGDLLVTSDIPGLAMKSQPISVGGVHIHRPGTIVGKALEPLAKGRGEILVLLSLQ